MAAIGGTIEEEVREWSDKLMKNILPPDPARILGNVLDVPADIEHASPLPVIVEDVHADYTEPAIEELPRLPLTGDFAQEDWLRYKGE